MPTIPGGLQVAMDDFKRGYAERRKMCEHYKTKADSIVSVRNLGDKEASALREKVQVVCNRTFAESASDFYNYLVGI